MPNRAVFTLPSGSTAAQAALADVVRRLGCVRTVGTAVQADIVIVLMAGPVPAEAALRAALEPAADGAFVLIGVHAPDGDGSIPPLLEDWATGGFYPLDLDALHAAICGGEEGWLDGDGSVRPEPATERECSKRNC